MMAQLYVGLDTGRFIRKAQPPGTGFPLPPHPVVQNNHRIVPVTCLMTAGSGEGAAMEAPYTVLISLQVSQALPLQGCYGAGLAHQPQPKAASAGFELLPFPPDYRSTAMPRTNHTQPPPAVYLPGLRTHQARSGRHAAGGARGRSCTPRPALAAAAMPAAAATAPSSTRSGDSGA